MGSLIFVVNLLRKWTFWELTSCIIAVWTREHVEQLGYDKDCAHANNGTEQ